MPSLQESWSCRIGKTPRFALEKQMREVENGIENMNAIQ